LTAIRTGAASGAATDLLARPESQTVAIFGAGVQARTQLEAVCTVRRVQMVWVYDPNQEKAERFRDEMAGQGPIPMDIRLAVDPGQAVREADIICTATTSRTPVFEDRFLKPGVHINAVGSYTPEMREVPAETVQRACLVVDSRPAALAEAGDILQPMREGRIDASYIRAELGEIVINRQIGRTDESQITLFKSVGLAVQDAAAARLAFQNARRASIGREVDW
jgi:ornithine cyclodeaminase